jgi:hypothetical protein
MFRFFTYILILFTTFTFSQSVIAATGSIVQGFHTTKVCHDSTCTSPTPGILNFRPTGATAVVVDDVSGLSGHVWGNELGWINLNPTGEGVTFANSTTGLLTGKAWSQVSGWVNFAPTGQSVTINPTTGEFSGWAWTGGPYGGWIKFDCSDGSTCIKTTWRGASSNPGNGGGGGGSMLIDVCPNIPNAQQTIPQGYTVNDVGNCIVVTPDLCPNIIGEQPTIPTGYTTDGIGACILSSIDFCPNISGNQSVVPSGYTVRSNGDCEQRTEEDLCPTVSGIQTSYDSCKKESAVDSCTNIPGLQSGVPSGHTSYGGQCFPETFDLCPNISGAQDTIPEGYTVGLDGSCMLLPIDVCANLAGYQEYVPLRFYQEGTNCFFGEQPQPGSKNEINGTEKTISFSFVPEKLFIVSDNSVIKAFTKSILERFGAEVEEPYVVDLFSFGIGIVGSVFALFGILLLIRIIIARFFI